jgi:hypothetical protein
VKCRQGKQDVIPIALTSILGERHPMSHPERHPSRDAMPDRIDM